MSMLVMKVYFLIKNKRENMPLKLLEKLKFFYTKC